MQTNKTYTTNQMLVINMAASAITYLVTFGISFFLSPYIVRTVGVEAYGFVGLANNFISYASLATVALNALSGRFITIRLYEKDIDGANKYFTSVFFANLAIGLIILLVETVVWLRLDRLIHVPAHIFWDVKILFGALFLNCIVSTVGSVFSVATFATNKLYLSSLRTLESSLIRAAILVLLFLIAAPHVWYLGVTSLITGAYCLLFNIRYTHILTPELRIRKKYFDFGAVKELITSGVWNLIIRLGQILLDGLDLLITNLFIDVSSMGILSLAKTVPAIIQSIISSMIGVFSPNFTILYAENRLEDLIRALKQSMKIMGVMANVPIIVLVVCGQDFFRLWQPTQNAQQLQVLSILTVCGFVVSGGINCAYSIFTVVNRLKVNALAVSIGGLFSIIVTFLVVKYTYLGVYAVAGVSSIISVLRNLVVTVPYVAKCLNLKWSFFFPDVIRPILFFLISVAVCFLAVAFLPAGGWLLFFIKACATGLISLIIGYFIVLNQGDRKYVLSRLKKSRE